MATDQNARKEAVMSSVRNEFALANAQELINVRGSFSLFPRIYLIKAVPKTYYNAAFFFLL